MEFSLATHSLPSNQLSSDLDLITELMRSSESQDIVDNLKTSGAQTISSLSQLYQLLSEVSQSKGNDRIGLTFISDVQLIEVKMREELSIQSGIILTMNHIIRGKLLNGDDNNYDELTKIVQAMVNKVDIVMKYSDQIKEKLNDYANARINQL